MNDLPCNFCLKCWSQGEYFVFPTDGGMPFLVTCDICPPSSKSQIPAPAGDAAARSSPSAVNSTEAAASCASPTLFDDAATRALR